MLSTWMKGAVVAGVAIGFAAVSAFNAGAAEQAAAAAAPAAAAAGPSAVDVLFERKHLGNLESGQEVVYRFQRTVSDEKMLGAPFSDDIKLDIKKVAADGTREVVFKVFTGDRARDPQDIPDLTGNPVLVVFLDRAVNNFAMIASGNRNYLKGKFRDALRENAKIEPVTVEAMGKKVQGYRVTVTPFEKDPNALKMLGYEGATFSFTVSDAVPGQFIELTSHYESGIKDAPLLDERITLASSGAAK
jgi:hypothetical protein